MKAGTCCDSSSRTRSHTSSTSSDNIGHRRLFMRVRTLIAATAILSLCVIPQAIAQSVSSADDTQIREVVRKYMAARELQDPKAVEALFTADADQLVSSGEWRRG